MKEFGMVKSCASVLLILTTLVGVVSADWGEYGAYVGVSRASNDQLVKFDRDLNIVAVKQGIAVQEYMAPSINGGGGLLTKDAQGLLVVWDAALNIVNTATVGDPLDPGLGLTGITRTLDNNLAIMRHGMVGTPRENTFDQISVWSGTDLSVQGAEWTFPYEHSLLTADADGGFFSWGSTQQLLVKWPSAGTAPVVATQSMDAYTVTDLVRLDGGNAAVYRGDGLNQISVWNGSDLSLVSAVSATEPEFVTPTVDGGFIAWHPTQDLLVKWAGDLTVENTVNMQGYTVDGISRLSSGNIVVSRGDGNVLSVWDESLGLVDWANAGEQLYMTGVDDGGFISYDSANDMLVKWAADLTIESTFAMDGFAPEGISVMMGDLAPALLAGDANHDGVVSAGDYASVQANFGNTGVAGLLGDANGDGVVSAGDYASVQANFGNTAATSAAVPEPATIGLLVIGGVALIRRKT